MQFATLEGKLVDSGGMVVKNVAGLDMGKLMIGSFGTLAAMAVINFKVNRFKLFIIKRSTGMVISYLNLYRAFELDQFA